MYPVAKGWYCNPGQYVMLFGNKNTFSNWQTLGKTNECVKKELSRKEKLALVQSIYFPTLTYGQALWELTETMRLLQVAQNEFPSEVGWVKSSDIQRE